METLFTALARALEGMPWIALSAAFAWGVLSIVLSPCHLASIPLIVGYISAEPRSSTGRAAALASVFALGILLTIAAVGGVTAALGRMLGDLGGWGNYFVAVIFFWVGLYLLGVVGMPRPGGGPKPARWSGCGAALALGLLFGIAVGPCTFAYMAPVLGVSFRAAATAPLYASALVLAYALGHCSVIILAGSCTDAVEACLRWHERSSASLTLKRACGALVIAGGLYLIYTAP